MNDPMNDSITTEAIASSLGQLKKATEQELESLQKQFSVLFMSYGELSIVLQVTTEHLIPFLSDEKKEAFKNRLEEEKTKFLQSLQDDKNNS
jgi:hypothetical protein